MFRLFIAVALSLAGAGSYANCYSVYNGAGVLLIRTTQAPVDLQHRIGDVVRAKFGDGASMVFSPDGSDCAPVESGGAAASAHWQGAGAVGNGSLSVYSSANSVYSGGYSGAARYLSAGARGQRPYAAGGYLHTGPRGGQYRYTASGGKSYQRRGR